MTVVDQTGLTWQEWLGSLNLHDAPASDIDYIERLTDLITRLVGLVDGVVPEDAALTDVRLVGSRAIGLVATPEVCLGTDSIKVCIAQVPKTLEWVVSVDADHVVHKHFLGRLHICPKNLLVNIPTFWQFEPFSSSNRRQFTGLVKSDYDLYAFILILFSDRLNKPE